MTLPEALDLVVSRTAYERFRLLCAEDNPDVEQRDAYQALILVLAADPQSLPPPADPASAALQAYVTAHPCGSC